MSDVCAGKIGSELEYNTIWTGLHLLYRFQEHKKGFQAANLIF
jgi:hypothetical protein